MLWHSAGIKKACNIYLYIYYLFKALKDNQEGLKQEVADEEKWTPKLPRTASVHEYSNMKLPRLCVHPFPTLL